MSARLALFFALVSACSGCGAAHETLDAGAPDAGTPDAHSSDGGPLDGAPYDAGLDAGHDAGHDAGARDTGPHPDADLTIRPRCAPPGTRALSVTYSGACRVDDTGQLWCWGNDDWGQVRPGGPTWIEPHEVAYEGLTDVVSVADSGNHRCVLHDDGGVSCWGSNRNGECGLPSSTAPVTHPSRVAGIDAADRLTVSAGTSCARMRADGRWMCWGGRGYPTTAFGAPESTDVSPVELPRLRGAIAFSIGANAGAIFDDGHVEAVAIPDSRVAHAYPLAGIDDAIDVVAFDMFVCVVRRGGEVWCAGSQTVADDPPPRRVPGIDDALSFATRAGSFTEACVVRADGTVWCWTMARDPAPWPVPGAIDVAMASLGAHVCAVTCDGRVLCNGTGERGENGDDTNRVAPYEVAGITDAVAIDGRCALRPDGTVDCWDAPHYGLYDPPCPPGPAAIETLPGVSRVVRLEDGALVRDDGSFACVSSASAVFSSAPAPIVDAACGGSASLVTTADGRLFYWGRSPTTGAPVAMPLATAAPVAELTPRAVRTSDGRVFDVECSSFFGIVCSASTAWPGISDAEAIWTSALRYLDLATVTATDCVRHVGGSVDCRFSGEALTALPPLLGIAVPAPSTFVNVPRLDGAAEIFAYDTMLCARGSTGAVDCWGHPSFGRLGDDDVAVTHTTPVAAGATELANSAATCALGPDGHVTCWGFVMSGWSSGALCPLPLDRTVIIP